MKGRRIVFLDSDNFDEFVEELAFLIGCDMLWFWPMEIGNSIYLWTYAKSLHESEHRFMTHFRTQYLLCIVLNIEDSK